MASAVAEPITVVWGRAASGFRSRGKAPLRRGRRGLSLKLKHFWFLDIQ